MSDLLLDISDKIDFNYINALNEVKKNADLLGIPFFIVGASARDFILQHYHGIPSTRMTTDIDLGILVSNWKQFDKMIDVLIKTGKFIKSKESQRISFENVLIDLMPFGPISGEDNRISWPPEHQFIMNMLGFKKAYENSIMIKLSSSPDLVVRVASLPGVVILKLLSWNDKYPDRGKDAEDLLFIMKNYDYSDNLNRLYDEESALLQEEGFDCTIAGIRLLGRDIAKISNAEMLKTIKKILSDETDEKSQYKLISQMIIPLGDSFDRILGMLNKLKQGILDNC
ncbi:MAG: nucleotidyl transferase AbiEii/AbiGii toxin family protein [Candidatus Omnitrophica bacterium]|nr:nucleotidyl transferase AbiEii/AbiGii toxin family protein [Candidatus Omnitrophota bacterium]